MTSKSASSIDEFEHGQAHGWGKLIRSRNCHGVEHEIVVSLASLRLWGDQPLAGLGVEEVRLLGVE